MIVSCYNDKLTVNIAILSEISQYIYRNLFKIVINSNFPKIFENSEQNSRLLRPLN